MMHDKNGRALDVGDNVVIEGVIKSLGGGEDYCNVSVETLHGRKPDGATETFHAINTAQLIRVEPGQEKVIADVRAERVYQDKVWGGAGFDAGNSEADWVKYITEYASGDGRGATHTFRTRMIKVAALAVAAVEAFDRVDV